MELDVLTMDQGEAQAKADEYRTIQAPSEEDRHIAAIFTALAAGKQVVDWVEAIRDAGVDELGHPVLAIAPTKQRWCSLFAEERGGRARFGVSRAWAYETRVADCVVTSMSGLVDSRGTLRSQVPIVPPAQRVRGWKSMLILWEVEEWAVAPRPPGDPILLKPLLGSLATVEAHWDLTDVERLVLGQRP